MQTFPTPPHLTTDQVLFTIAPQRGEDHDAAQCDDACNIAVQRGAAASIYTTPFKLKGLPTYPGSKAQQGTYQTLINAIPPHDTYVEPFAGGGAIMRHKRPAKRNVLVELDEQIAEIWYREAPKGIEVVPGDAFTWLNTAPLDRRTFLFVDPPYIGETLGRTNGYYRHNFTQDQHRTLLTTLRSLRCMVMVCSLPNLLYENMLKGWRTFQYQNKTRKGSQTEQVWMNYSAPKRLHDYRYLGEGMRERERIKRLLVSNERLFNARPVLERIALLDHLNKTVKRS